MECGFLLWRGKEHEKASSSENGFALLLLCLVVNLGSSLWWVLVGDSMDDGDGEGLKLKTWKRLGMGMGFGGKRKERETELSIWDREVVGFVIVFRVDYGFEVTQVFAFEFG